MNASYHEFSVKPPKNENQKDKILNIQQFEKHYVQAIVDNTFKIESNPDG